MRILFLNPVAQLGGAERILLDLIAAVRARAGNEHEMHVMLLDDGPLVAQAERAGADWVHVLPMPAAVASMGESGDAGAVGLAVRGLVASPALVAYVRRLKRAIGEVDPDIIHSNGVKTHVLSRLIVPRGSRAKVVWHVHDLLGQRAVMGKLLRRFAGRTDAAIAISEAVGTDARAVLPRTKVHVVLNGIDVEHFAPGNVDSQWLDHVSLDPVAQRPACSETTSDRVVRAGLVATYARWKGQDQFIDAISRVMRSRSEDATPVRFYIVGGPIYSTAGSQFSREELRARASEAGVASHVSFVEFQADPRDVYRALDVVVHASTRPEPFGRTIAEAMACGRAVVVSRAGGAAELFADGQDALGFEPGNADDLARAVQRLIDDPSLRARLGSAARETAQQRFDRRRMADEVMSVYRNLVGETG